jgi:hypothetical protein
MEFLLQPNVYSTAGTSNLLQLLEKLWMKNQSCFGGTIYIVSGFSNYNGGVRFYPFFADYIRNGGKIIAYFGASTSQRLSSLQVVEALLQCGAEVNLVNRKRLLHAKCYGFSNNGREGLVVTSGNFTGPGMSQNAETSILVDENSVRGMSFRWSDFVGSINNEDWDIHNLTSATLSNRANPAWGLLYDEVHGVGKLPESQKVTMVVLLSHSDTARIQATLGSDAGKGTQYFWLSKGSFDFFPALTEKNKRGYKNTFSCTINTHYIDIDVKQESKVTFEADNNLDFRLGTGPYRYTKVANEGDLALITRLSDYDYEIRIIKKNAKNYNAFSSYATTFIGGKGKRFGYISNSDMVNLM